MFDVSISFSYSKQINKNKTIIFLRTSNAVKPVKDYDSSVFAISKDTDDIILIEESESTQEMFQNLIVKTEDSVLKESNKQYEKTPPPPMEKKKPSPVPATPPARSGCDDCDNVGLKKNINDLCWI